MRRNATKEEIENITKWFNSATDIRRNRRFAGTTPDAGIIIKLKSGGEISLVRSGEDFEIQRDYGMGTVSYWVKQPDIKKLLDQLATPLATYAQNPLFIKIRSGLDLTDQVEFFSFSGLLLYDGPAVVVCTHVQFQFPANQVWQHFFHCSLVELDIYKAL